MYALVAQWTQQPTKQKKGPIEADCAHLVHHENVVSSIRGEMIWNHHEMSHKVLTWMDTAKKKAPHGEIAIWTLFYGPDHETSRGKSLWSAWERSTPHGYWWERLARLFRIDEQKTFELVEEKKFCSICEMESMVFYALLFIMDTSWILRALSRCNFFACLLLSTLYEFEYAKQYLWIQRIYLLINVVYFYVIRRKIN